MSQGRVLLTGATGFIGSHVAEALLRAGYEVAALRRASSSLDRLAGFVDQLKWIDSSVVGWEKQIAAYQARIVLHTAWLGVHASERDDWPTQLANLDFTLRLLEAAAQGPLRQVVVLGSQAEYGEFTGRVEEVRSVQPTTAYGAVKVAVGQLVQTFCETRGVAWHWLRVFAAFGPREDARWFVSHVINSLLKHAAPLRLTAGEQRYDYSYVGDLAQAVIQVLAAGPAASGVYNLAANAAVPLRELVEIIRQQVSQPTEVEFGALPYRPGQIMHMEGSTEKFERAFGPLLRTPLPEALAATVNFWRTR